MSFFNSTAGTNTHTHSVTKSVSQGLARFLRPDKVKTSAQNRVTKLRLQRENKWREGKSDEEM